MSRPTVMDGAATRTIENALFVVGEGRENLAEESRLLTLLGGLEEAEARLMALDTLQEAEAYADVEVAERNLRNAKLRLEETQTRKAERERIEAQQRQIFERFRALWVEEARTFDEVTREFAEDAEALGIRHVRVQVGI